MKTIYLIFPHQLFKSFDWIEENGECYLIEENLFFSQYNFHKQKLAFHRASMKFYQDFLTEKGLTVNYISTHESKSDIRKLIAHLAQQNVPQIKLIDPTDNWLEKRITQSCLQYGIHLTLLENPQFLNSQKDLEAFFRKDKKKFFQTEFYIQQRKKRGLLLEENGQPKGGKWSFDAENRKKYPKRKNAPKTLKLEATPYYNEARKYVKKYFSGNIGELSETSSYPVTHQEAEDWFQDFLNYRFAEFGTYEDAIVQEELILNHSLLSPLLNAGLLNIKEVVNKAHDFAEKENTPINSVEGFIRQLIGWREFIRAVYEVVGSKERTSNFWGFTRKIPASFYSGTTGIKPLDQTLKKVLKTGYCHHIERLMVLGNFMLLCEFDPDEVYRWFMELFIDSYDWVMVPNIYGMSQFADGGLMSTKPYISGSNYLMKMSNYEKGEWQSTWDALYWRFINVHRDFFTRNPRLSLMVNLYDKMSEQKKKILQQKATEYLDSL